MSIDQAGHSLIAGLVFGGALGILMVVEPMARRGAVFVSMERA